MKLGCWCAAITLNQQLGAASTRGANGQRDAFSGFELPTKPLMALLNRLSLPPTDHRAYHRDVRNVADTARRKKRSEIRITDVCREAGSRCWRRAWCAYAGQRV